MFRAGRSAWPWAAVPIAGVLAVDPSGLAPFGPIKWALVPSLVLLGAALLWRDGRLAMEGRALPAFVGWSAVTAVFGLDRLYAWTGTPERHFGVLGWSLVLLSWWAGRSLDGRERQLVLAVCAAVAACVGAWAVAEAIGWRPLHLVGIGDRPVGPLGSSAFLGAAATLLTPVALGFAVQARRRGRAAAVAASGLGLAAVALSGARAAWFGSLVAAAVAVIVVRQRRVVIAVGMCALVVVLAGFASGATSRVSSIASDRDGGARGRLDEWRVALRVVEKRPVVGTGPEGYRIAFGESVDDRYERAHGRDPVPDRAHSAVLDVAATTGLPGLALYLVAVGGAIAGAVRTLRRGSPLLAGVAVGVIACFAQSLALFPIAELEPIAWLLAGFVAAAGRGPHVRHIRQRALSLAAGALAVLAVVAGVLDVTSDRRAQRALARNADDEIASADAARLRPDQVRYRLVDARIHENGSTLGLQRALADVDAALDVSPRDPVAQRERGRLLLELARRGGSVTTARNYLEQLVDHDPRNAETLLRFGIAEDLAGHERAAIAAWKRAEYLAPRSASASSNLAVAYAKAGRIDDAKRAARRALRRDPQNEPARKMLEELEKSGT